MKNFTAIPKPYYRAYHAADLTLVELKLLGCVIDYTLGWNQRKEADIGFDDFRKFTKLSLSGVRKGIRGLMTKGLIKRIRQGSTDHQPATYLICTDPDTWAVSQAGHSTVSQVEHSNTPFTAHARNIVKTRAGHSTVLHPTSKPRDIKERKKVLKKGVTNSSSNQRGCAPFETPSSAKKKSLPKGYDYMVNLYQEKIEPVTPDIAVGLEVLSRNFQPFEFDMAVTEACEKNTRDYTSIKNILVRQQHHKPQRPNAEVRYGL